MRLVVLLISLMPSLVLASSPPHIGKRAADPLVRAALKEKRPNARITFMTGGHTLDTPKSVSNHFYIVHVVEDGKQYTGTVTIDMRKTSPRDGVARVKKVKLSRDRQREADLELLQRTAAALRASGSSPALLAQIERQLEK